MLPDRVFLKAFFKIALPVALQNLFIASLGIVDTLMVGQMGEVPIAAVGLANQVYFILILVIMGVTSGAAIFVAQYWGKRDLRNIHRALGLSLAIGFGVGLLMTIPAILFSRQVLSLYTNDPAVITSGAEYLKIAAFSYIPVAVLLCYAAVLRSVGHVRLPVLISVVFLCMATIMNYGLVLGHFGLPALGVRGAAISALTTRCLECTTLLLFVYLKKLPAAASLRELTDFPAGFVQRYFKVATVVVLNEVFWSTGATMLSAVYAHISTDAIAAMNIARAIQGLSLFVSGATMTACAILVGNKIGEGQTETAERYAHWSLITGAIGSIAAGLLIIGASTWLLNIYQIPQETRTAAYWIVVIYGLTQWIRTIDGTIIVGILRSGGDTLFSGIVDVASVWLVALPAVYLGGIVLGLPIEWVALISMVESTFKVCLGLPRVRSRKWINNLAAG